MSCNLLIENNEVNSRLKESTRGNNKLFASYISTIMTKDGIDETFAKEVKDKFGVSVENIPDDKLNDIVNFIKEYHNRKNPDIYYSSKVQNDSTDVGRFGYSSIADRNLGLRICANFMLDFSHQAKYDNEEGSEKIKDAKTQHFEELKSRIETILIERIQSITGLDEDSASDILDDVLDGIETVDVLEDILQVSSNIQNANLLALFKEIQVRGDELLKEIIRDQRLGELRKTIKRDENGNIVDSSNTEDNQYEASDEQQDDESTEDKDTENNTDETVKDKTLSQLDNKAGLYDSFTTHIDNDVRSYFARLKKLNSKGKINNEYDYNKDNAFGIPDVMNANECCAVLYSRGVFTNVDDMIDSIRNIANTVPGFMSFHIMADYLKENTDFAWKVYSTFGKFIIEKLETIHDSEDMKCRVSNNTNIEELLKFEYYNSLKATIISNDPEYWSDRLHKLNEKISAYNTVLNTIRGTSNQDVWDVADNLAILDSLEPTRLEIISELYNILNKYYPTVSEGAVVNYIETANNGDFNTNILNLYKILNSTINSSRNVQDIYSNRQAKISFHYAKLKNLTNASIKQDIADIDGVKVSIKDIKEQNDILEILYAKEYMDLSSQSAAFNLAKTLVGYTAVKTELNSRNVHGNQSSDVINNSMITNILNTLKSKAALNQYGNYKFQSRQYDFSNILMEHKDEKGNVINYGLFRKDEKGIIVPTDYAESLLKVRLFNGATDTITSTNVLYSEMSKADYITTAFVNFFNPVQQYRTPSEKSAIGETANYFLRIPSDAPKNFIATLPKYTVKNLFITENKEEVTALINKTISEKLLSNEIYLEQYAAGSEIKVTLDDFVKHTTNTELDDVTLGYSKNKNVKTVLSNLKANIGDTVYVNMQHVTEDGVDTNYVLEGVLIEDNGKLILNSPELVGIVNKGISTEAKDALKNAIAFQLLKEGFVKQSINVEHPIYKQFRNAFVQELTDAAVALDLFFDNRNGIVKLNEETNAPEFNKGFDNTKNTARTLYALYHVGKGKTIYEKDDNGNAKLTGSVFTSNKFSITKETEEGQVITKNYGQEIIDEAFDFLYGGANNTHLHFTKNDNKIEVSLTPEQENKVKEKLVDFIKDYVSQISTQLEEFEDFIPSELMDLTNIEEFALNYYLTYMSFDDIFEGNTKFYKDSQTFLKRAKETQASGVPYGIVNYAKDLSAAPESIISSLDKTTFTRKYTDANGNTIEEPVKFQLRSKFKGITIKNTIKTSDAVAIAGETKINGEIVKKHGAVTKALIQALKNDGLSSKQAEEKAKKIMRGYHETTVNDAQSFITFEEWVRRITARGQFPQYKQLIEAILDETKPLDAKTLEAFIQVQKNYYYDHYYNSRLQTMAPRQIKNAEFVLVPRLIKGTELEEVYNLMKLVDIDQLNTEEASKAAKANVLTLWDDNGVLTETNIEDFKAHAVEATEYYDYNYLYTQLETPQHVNSTNKAGIQIVKKILDNIAKDSNNPLYKYKERFFEIYTANIKTSFSDLMDELGVVLTKNGTLDLTEDNNIKGLEYQLLYDMVLEEMLRLGVDSNMLDYATLSEVQTGLTSDSMTHPITKMPSHMSNVGPKLESIAQSLFNNRITRQKLHGFHAAQVTNVGFGAFNTKVSNRTYSKSLRYHPEVNGKVQPYSEILLPASAFGFNKNDKVWKDLRDSYLAKGNTLEEAESKVEEEMLKNLQDEGLDMLIGYRIPTEGKQSIAIMKVVGFVDDALGSTIVLPDDWVGQTGADFDIDSVYGIQYKSRVNPKTGKLEKIEYKETFTEHDYFTYLRHKGETIKSTKLKKKVDKLKDNVIAAMEDEFTALTANESEAYHNLPTEIREKIKTLQNITKTDNKKEDYINQNNNVVQGLTEYIESNNIKGKLKKQINKYIDIRKEINNTIIGFSEEYYNRLNEGISELKTNRLSTIENIAKEAGLLSYEEWKKLSTAEKNTKNARNNGIVDCMIEILKSPLSLEENVSRSQFKDLTDGRDKSINANIAKLRKNRSSYNILDQAAYQEDVMSGAKLKAFSVTRDTFCSICNTVKPVVSDEYAITAVYKESDGYNLKQLQKSFDNVEEIQDGVYKVTHNTFGWSKNNKNVENFLITVYSSQTTAHILDAVKEGSIPNENDFTFGVFKLFPDMGLDYATATSFIMQPGISRIIKQYNKNKSIYTRGNKKYIENAIKEIVAELTNLDNIIYDTKQPLSKILTDLSGYNSSIARLFNADKDFDMRSNEPEQIAKLLFNSNRMSDRLNNRGVFAPTTSPVEDTRRKLLFDLGVILQYNRLSNLANAISDYARVSNPDKFGAKQTIFSTNKVISDIRDILNKPSVLKVKVSEEEEIDFIKAIYPGFTRSTSIDDIITSTNEQSAYPPLYYFLKFATATSIKINRLLFQTQNVDFRNNVMSLEEVFSGPNTRINEKLYKQYERYILNTIYNNTQAIANSISWRKGEGFVYNVDGNLEEERARIYGFGKSPNIKVPIIETKTENGNTVFVKTKELVNFEVKDINNPTQIEIEQFATLSPAQKVNWIQEHFKESGVFKYLRTTTFNSKEYRGGKAGTQTIQYIENNQDIETVYSEFENCFYNDNPFVALAAFDLIKYSFVVEGFRIRMNAVNKVIKNNALMDSGEQGGTNIVNEINNKIADMRHAGIDITEVRTNFVRSHSNMYQIETHRVDRINYEVRGKKRKKLELTRLGDNVLYFNLLDEKSKALAEKYGFIHIDNLNVIHHNAFVKLKFEKDTMLYNIVRNKDEIIAYPLNLLEEVENSEWSINVQNNKYPSEQYYKTVVKKYLGITPSEANVSGLDNLTNVIKQEQENKKNYIYKSPVAIASNMAKPFDINDNTGTYAGGFEQVRDAVTKYYKIDTVNNKITTNYDAKTNKLYIRSNALKHFITKEGSINGSVQIINGIPFKIEKANFSKYNNAYVGDKNKHHKVSIKNEQIEKIMIQAQDSGYRVNDAFIISPYTEPGTNTRKSSVTERSTIKTNNAVGLGVQSMNFMVRNKNSDNLNTKKYIDRLHKANILTKDTSVKANLEEVISTTAEFVEAATGNILDNLNYFTSDESGTFYAINTPEAIDAIRNDETKRNEFLKLLLDARSLVSAYSLIKDLNISSEDPSIHRHLNKIVNCVDKLEKATIINEAEENFALDYLKKLSDNPNIKGDIHSLLEGFHSAGYFDAWINDLQETSSPLIQIITKEVMGNIRGEEMKAKEALRTFKANVARIKQLASDLGLTINWDNIIDENGKFIQDFNEAFIEKIQSLKDDISNAITEYGEGSIEHIKAKFEYDKFKLNHIEQLLVDDYYQQRLEIEKNIIDKYPTIYSAYKKLEIRRSHLYDRANNGVLDQAYQDELKEINKEITNLTSLYYYDGSNYVEKPAVGDPTNPFTGEQKLINTIDAAIALKNYLTSSKELREKYFARDSKYGFEEELEKNLNIIDHYERRDNKGRITTPTAELLTHPDYVAAKEWLDRNAIFVVDKELKDKVNKAFEKLKQNSLGRELLKRLAKAYDLYDNHGVIDATKLTEKQIEQLKEEELRKYNIKEGAVFSDRSLIHSAPTDDTVFSSEFYKKMTMNGAKNQDYLKKVNEINKILILHWDAPSKSVITSEMSIEELQKLRKLYEELEDIKKTENSTNGKAVRKFIEEEVEFVYDWTKYEIERHFAEKRGKAYFKEWQRVNESVEDYKVVPNRYIYGYAVPKGYKPDGSGSQKYIDNEKTEALRTIKNNTVSTYTIYYYNKYKEMKAKSQEEFDAWYEANHVYNPYTNTVEPLSCWTTIEIRNSNVSSENGTWIPSYNQTRSRPKDGRTGEEDYVNHNYTEGVSTSANYKAKGKTLKEPTTFDFSDNIDYSNNKVLNEAEKQMKELFETTLRLNATISSAKRFLDKGYMAARYKSPEKNAKYWGNEALKLVGWINNSTGRETWIDDVDYTNDIVTTMPMMSILKSKDSLAYTMPKPYRSNFSTEEEYKAKLKEYEEEKQKIDKENAKIHKDMLDRNWESVMEDFIIKSAHFNAIQQNKYMLFYGQKMLDKLETYVRNIGFENLRKDYLNSNEDQTRYLTKKDTRLQDQYANWIRRLVWDQWKQPNNSLTRVANLVQSFTSAKFMMFNITGGIANVTLGETQILGELFANEHFDKNHWLQGKAIYGSGIGSYLADIGKEKSTSLANAFIRWFGVVDFDNVNEAIKIPNADTMVDRLRNFAYSPQASGEHYMQNSVLFMLASSHRLVPTRDSENNGRLTYTLMNEAEYIRDEREKAFYAILTDKQKNLYDKFKSHELSDANKTKDYAWFRKDLITEFSILYLTKEQQEEFNNKRKELEANAITEFNDDIKHPTLYSQFKLGNDGILDFKDDSILNTMNDEKYKLLGRFKGRVISLNKKIHGVYDNLGAAQIESQWWGGLVMQYHKHIYPGIMKRYRRQGYFNEERGTIEKGAYTALKDFLALPLHKAKFANKLKADNNMTDAELQAIQGIQNVFKEYINFFTHIKLNWDLIPKSDRSAILRGCGDLVGVLAGICTAIALRCIADDDDEQGFLYNLFMYEADRLTSEAAIYNPLGVMSEARKLWSSPIAAQTTFKDTFHVLGLCAQYIMEGEEFDPYYSSGAYAGENKFWVNIKRNIPMYHGVYMLERLSHNNKYYKLGENMLTIIPTKDIADWISE